MRSFWIKGFVCVLSMGAWASIAYAQNEVGAVGAAPIANAQNSVVAPDKEAKDAAAESIVARAEAAANRAFDPGYRAAALKKLASLTSSQLESIQSQRDAGLGVSPMAYGSSGLDLVYTPVTPCRIIDTRVAVGPIFPGVNRSYWVTGTDFASQGGVSTSCGIPFGPATAVALNLVSVSPPSYGDFRAFPYGQAVPNASVLNYIAGQNVANGITLTICNPAVATCNYDFTVQADGNYSDLVVDVEGYYSRLPSTLASGITLVGTYAIDFPASAANQEGTSAITFPIPLATAPTANVIAAGGSPTTNCPGSSANPEAAAGQFCVYETQGVNVSSRCIAGVAGSWVCGTAATFGASVWVTSTAGGSRTVSIGTWAVTAP